MLKARDLRAAFKCPVVIFLYQVLIPPIKAPRKGPIKNQKGWSEQTNYKSDIRTPNPYLEPEAFSACGR
jgi:hypothetical protein